MCDSFVRVNNNRSSIIALQNFLLCKQSKISFIYDCQIDEDIFNSIGILWYKYELLPKYGKIPLYLLEVSPCLNSYPRPLCMSDPWCWHLCMHTVMHLVFRKWMSMCIIFAIFMFKCLKSVMTLISIVTFLLISITGLEYAENLLSIYLNNTIFSSPCPIYCYLLP